MSIDVDELIAGEEELAEALLGEQRLLAGIAFGGEARLVGGQILPGALGLGG